MVVELTQGGFLTYGITFFIMGFAMAAKTTLPKIKIKKILLGRDTILHGLIDRDNSLKIDVVKYGPAIKRGDNFYCLTGIPVNVPGVGNMYLHHWNCTAPLDLTNDSIEKAKSRLAAEHPDIDLNKKVNENGELQPVAISDVIRGLTADNTGMVYRAAKAKGAATSMLETLAAIKMQRNFIYLIILLQVALLFHLQEVPEDLAKLKTLVQTITNNLSQGQAWGVK